MKTVSNIAALCALLFTACQSETKQLLSALDGRWAVTTATYSGGSRPDSVATLTSTYLTFERCSSSANGSSPTNCRAEYTLNSQLYSFTYQAPNEGKSLYLSATNQMSDPSYRAVASQVAGSYDVLTLSNNLLVMRRSLSGTGSTYQTVQFSASK
jgi:hypothetical protein